jgi:hypothetical protein
MIQVWQVGIINTQVFWNYFLLMMLGLADFSTGEGIDAVWGRIGRYGQSGDKPRQLVGVSNL